MKLETSKDLDYYLALPYTIIVRKDEDGDFVARVQELSGCISHGDAEATAIENLRSMQRLWIEDALAAGEIIPEPERDADLPSGRWVQRVPRKLHRDLVRMAEMENVSLNQMVTSLLSHAVTEKSCVYAVEAAISKALHRDRSASGQVTIAGMPWWGAPVIASEGGTGWSHPGPIEPELTKQLSRVKDINGDLTDRMFFGIAEDEHARERKQLTHRR